MRKVDHPPAATDSTAERAFENGRDMMAADIAVTIRLMQRAGMTDSEVADGIIALATGKLVLNLPAAEWFA